MVLLRLRLCKGYKKDIFAILLTGFEPHGLFGKQFFGHLQSSDKYYLYAVF